MSLSVFPVWVAAERKEVTRVEVNISLAFLHWVEIALLP